MTCLIRILRKCTQIFAALVLTYLLFRQDFSTAQAPLYAWLGWLDPLTGLAGFLRGAWPWLILLSLASLLAAALWGRLFCGWLCPVGTVLDLLAAGKRATGWRDWRPGPRAARFLGILRWVILGGIVGLVLSGFTLSLTMNPFVLWARETHRVLARLIPWSLLALCLFALLFFPRFWCRYLCPAGSVLGLAARLRGRTRNATAACKNCRLCVSRCPMVNIDGQIRFGGDCLSCGACIQSCPVHSLAKPRPSVPVDEGRRDLLAASGAALGLLALGGVSRRALTAIADDAPRWSRFLRPPGALAEAAFRTACDRCGQCLQACPTKCLVPAGLEAGLAGFWTPRFVPRRGRCMLCNACDLVCPTRALAPVAPDKIRMGTAEIRREKCVAWAKGLRCFVCIEVCSKFAIPVDARARPLVDESKCIGCGACEANCPVEGAAIRIVNRGEIRR